ncbi:type II toxin-antitoxin system VapB family antitoxin [Phenylobacterium aquaticum]|uniref:type II toxin-antitoxin system VapB family antitoxin n=1 Tax=Phenylobacterium aquaticum TaxID=1763816 RepID=UPI0026EEE05B|nr:type II toxin-antitoxin system VapB family antitoxin [Phenylobacterium aquaticum]
MAFHVRDPETDTLVRELARKRGVGITDAIKLAVAAELERVGEAPSQMDRIREIQARIAERGRTGFVADKAFFDWLSGEEDV